MSALKRLPGFWATLLIAITIGAALYVLVLYNSLASMPDAYASDWSAVFVIEHLKASGGAWPTDWDDLRDEYDRMANPSHYAWTFDELQQRVSMRFDVSARQVREADPPLQVIRLTSGRQVSFDGDPNLQIRNYLRGAEGRLK